MIIEIDFNSPEAIYLQLRNQIVVAIATEELQDGESLPSVRALANSLGVNMHTVNKAYAILRQEGYLKLDRRKGAVISVEVLEEGMTKEEFSENLKLTVAEAICRGIDRKELCNIVNHLYDVFENKQAFSDYHCDHK